MKGENGIAKFNDEGGGSSDNDSSSLRLHQVRAEDLDVPEAASPAPIPMKGGEDDVVRLSHVRSIEVKPAMPSPPTSSAAATAATTPSKVRPMRPSRRSPTQDPHDDEASDCAPMDVIDKSPYEPMSNAEKGEKLFTEMKALLSESNNDDYRSVSPQATKIFGPTNAWCLVKANGLIDKSGMVYSQEWVNGNIRGNLIGKIPNDLLLLCLVSKRFVKAGELLLSGLTRDLEVYNIVKEAIIAWKLDDEYKRVSSCSKNFPFTAKKRDCFKCEIFVARVYCCYKAFGSKGKIPTSLMSKVKRCLEIMESRLPDPGTASKKKRKSMASEKKDEPPAAVAAAIEDSPASSAPAPKKRRGRPPKNRAKEKEVIEEEPPSPMEESEDEEPEYVVSSSKKRGRRSNGKKDNSTLAQLVARFEDQYREMGERYEEMGDTLSALKVKIEENRDKTEKEIRNELLQEVQRTIMSSFPKK